ncbi:MAG: BofC C-terminal domain-containing protein [Oscillospiraceae bacterium]|nr:BofC C-terminal domain-containing protein [Oscillospiraceae bacterium]
MGKHRYLYCILLLGFLLGVKDGYITLWRDGQAEPVKVFPYRVTMLPEKDRAALEKGIRIEENSDLARLMEDYLS